MLNEKQKHIQHILFNVAVRRMKFLLYVEKIYTMFPQK